MNRLEFEKVLEVTDIKNIIDIYYGRDRVKGPVYEWNGFKFFFSGSYYTIVSGDFPIDFLDIIYRKYSSDKYSIRYNLGDKKNSDIKFNNCCHIDTKEGLLCFITELQDYYYGKDISDSQVNKQKDLIKMINKNLIMECNLGLTSKDWIERYTSLNINDLIHKSMINNNSEIFRQLLDELDKLINPFVEDSAENDTSLLYSDLFNLFCYSDKKDVSIFYAELIENNEIYIKYTRDEKKLLYKLFYLDDVGKKIEINHYFEIFNSDLEKFDELIEISHWYVDSDDVRNIDFKYSLVTGLAYDKNGNILSLTENDKNFIIDELNKAILTIKKVYNHNINCSDNVKKLVLNK